MSVLPSTSSKFLVKSSLVHIESQSPSRSIGWLVNPHSYPIPHWSGSPVGIIRLEDFCRLNFGGFLTGFRRGVIDGDRDSFTVWALRVWSNFTFSSDLKAISRCARIGGRCRKINKTWTDSNLGSNSLLNFWFCWIWSFSSFAFISFARFLACYLFLLSVPNRHVTGFHVFSLNKRFYRFKFEQFILNLFRWRFLKYFFRASHFVFEYDNMKVSRPHQVQLQSKDTAYKCISEFVETNELYRVKMHYF